LIDRKLRSLGKLAGKSASHFVLSTTQGESVELMGRISTAFGSGNLKRKDHLEDLIIDRI
jgi:hypothetical protein